IAIVEADEEILDARRPVARETDLHAAARRPTGQRLILGQTKALGVDAAIGEAGCTVEQNVVEGVAGTRPQRAEPGIGELPGRDGAAGGRDRDLGSPADKELAALQVVAAVEAACDAGRIGRVAGGVGPLVAEMLADVAAGPIIDADWGTHERDGREIGRTGCAGRERQADGNDARKYSHGGLTPYS